MNANEVAARLSAGGRLSTAEMMAVLKDAEATAVLSEHYGRCEVVEALVWPEVELGEVTFKDLIAYAERRPLAPERFLAVEEFLRNNFPDVLRNTP